MYATAPRAFQTPGTAAANDDARAPALPGKRTLTEQLQTGQLPHEIVVKAAQALGHDVSTVTVHEGGEAEAIGTRAFARGNELHFTRGAYQPATADGVRLIGHELVHVAQQRQGRAPAT